MKREGQSIEYNRCLGSESLKWGCGFTNADSGCVQICQAQSRKYVLHIDGQEEDGPPDLYKAAASFLNEVLREV